ncbi:MAG: urease accessory protein UreD [Actinomycetota bacterium]
MRIVDARCEPPYAVRCAGRRVLVAASAAGPLGGDEFDLSIAVDPGAVADVGTVGAAMVMPGASGAASSSHTSITVDAGARLDWWPEPTISVAGSDHTLATHVQLAGDAACTVVEEIALGRSGEVAGHLHASLRVERNGQPLLHHAESYGPSVPGTGSVVSVGDARHVLTAVIVGASPARGACENAVPETSETDESVSDASVTGEIVLGETVLGTAAARLALGEDVSVVLIAAPDRPAALDAAARLGLTHRRCAAPRIDRVDRGATVDALV